MKKLIVGLCAFLVSQSALASCWVVPGPKGLPEVILDITTDGKSAQLFVDSNPDMPGNQPMVLKCTGFIDPSGAESQSCYDPSGDLGIWVILPDISDREKGIGWFSVIPTFRNGQIKNIPMKFARCSNT